MPESRGDYLRWRLISGQLILGQLILGASLALRMVFNRRFGGDGSAEEDEGARHAIRQPHRNFAGFAGKHACRTEAPRKHLQHGTDPDACVRVVHGSRRMPWQRPRGLVHGRAGADGQFARFSLEAKPDELRWRRFASVAANGGSRAESQAMARAWEPTIVRSRCVAQCCGIREGASTRDCARRCALRATQGACAAASRRAVA